MFSRLITSLLLPLAVFAQGARQDPVKWTATVEPAAAAPGGTVLFRLTATVEPGWHLYSTTTPDGPIPTRISIAETPHARPVRLLQPSPHVKFDPNFQLDTQTYDGATTFLIEATVSANAPSGALPLTAEVRYQVCSDTTCLRPVKRTAEATLNVDPAIRATPPSTPEGYVPGVLAGTTSTPAPNAPAAPQPSAAAQPKSAQTGWGSFLLVAFGFGLASIFTPCVFPMIPFTMGYFLNRPQDEGGGRSGTLFHAALFCIGIVVLFTGLGLLTTALLGASGLAQIGSNVWVNLFIAAVFGIFGLSMLGAFELTLPAGLLTRLDSASRQGGVLGTLVMGLTFSLTSFACIGPFVGPLLAASVQGDRLQPALGMTAFSAGLAAPFFLLALFPGYLKRMPRSGGWLPRVKIVMGFVILAVMFKYLSNVDVVMHWNLLTRERFLAAWVVLFALPGLYLLGRLRMEGIDPESPLGVGRALTGSAFLIFALSIVPGMFGGRLGDLDAFVPAPTESFGGSGQSAAGHKWIKDDYNAALAAAKAENKLVFVNFTGYTCTNCKWMKFNMFPRPEVTAAMADFVLVELYTDGSDPASEANAKMQETRFNTAAIPFYAILTSDGQTVATWEGLERDTSKFLAFLKTRNSGS